MENKNVHIILIVFLIGMIIPITILTTTNSICYGAWDYQESLLNPSDSAKEREATEKAARDLVNAQARSARLQIEAQEKSARLLAEAQKAEAQKSQMIQIGGFLLLGAIGVYAVKKKDSNKQEINEYVSDKVCPQCGKTVQINDAFCNGCGTKIES